MKRVLVVLTLLSLVLVACGSKPAAPAPAPGAGSSTPAPAAAPAAPVPLAALCALTGPTSDVGVPYCEGEKAFFDWYNGKGGIKGRKIDFKAEDYAYQVPKAQELYSKYINDFKAVAIMGWGTGDTVDLAQVYNDAQKPLMSGSFAEELSDVKTHPYNFLIATSYSDEGRILLKYIKDNWKESRAPKVVMSHADSPFGNAPIGDMKAYAKTLGFEVLSDAVVASGALEADAQMLTAKNAGADFVIINQTTAPTVATLKSAKKVGLTAKMFGLIWTAAEDLITGAGETADGFIATVSFSFPYEDNPNLKDMKDYLAGKGDSLDKKTAKWVQGWTAGHLMTMAMEAVAGQGKEINGPNIKAALETFKDVKIDGVLNPLTFTATAHKGTLKTTLYQVKGGKFQALTTAGL